MVEIGYDSTQGRVCKDDCKSFTAEKLHEKLSSADSADGVESMEYRMDGWQL